MTIKELRKALKPFNQKSEIFLFLGDSSKPGIVYKINTAHFTEHYNPKRDQFDVLASLDLAVHYD